MTEKVITTYLELTDKDRFNPKDGYLEKLDIREVSPEPYLNAVLFAGVGMPWRWYSRLGWTMDEWETHFADHDVATYLCFSDSNLVGYYELEFDGVSSAEIRFLGLFPQHMGKGLGGMMLSHAVRGAREKGVSRVWLHTCTKDADAALANYIARGFRVFKTKEADEDLPGKEEMINRMNQFIGSYIDRFGTGR